MSDLIQVHILKGGKRIHWAQKRRKHMNRDPIFAFALRTFAMAINPILDEPVTIEILTDKSPNFIKPAEQGPVVPI